MSLFRKLSVPTAHITKVRNGFPQLPHERVSKSTHYKTLLGRSQNPMESTFQPFQKV